MERWLREAIYGGEKPWELLIGTATKVGWVVLLVGLVFAGPRDYRRMRIRKYGRRTKGPELVRAAGKLIGLLPVFASALPVALACDHGVAAAFPADASAG